MFASVQNFVNLRCFTGVILADTPIKYTARAIVDVNVVLEFYRGKHFEVIHERKKMSKSNLYVP